MQRNNRSLRWSIQHRLTFNYLVVMLASVILSEGLALVLLVWVMPSLPFALEWGVHVGLMVIGVGVLGLLIGLWISQPLVRRLQRIREISQAWLRGNLALRIADPCNDELGYISTHLDALAEHLEDDEQDLVELRERNARLTDQVRALAVVEERNRLARELHDSVKQYIFSLAMTASAVKARFETWADAPEDLEEMIREIETSAQNAQRETTRLIEDLRPGSLQENGLAATLNDYTLLFGAQEHILVYVEVQGDDAHLTPSVAEALYRVAQEALHNVARHAHATRVDVHLKIEPEYVMLTVRDNGVGFDPHNIQRGLGLSNMQERVMAIGGRLTFDGQVGSGTTVQAEVGLAQPFSALTLPTSTEKQRPQPTIENWAWLGQKLVIPVGQVWPWLPADLVHLQRPTVQPNGGSLKLKGVSGFFGLKRNYVLQFEGQQSPLARIHHSSSGYEWEFESVSWALRDIRGLSGRMVLTRNRQPLAAMQYQGPQMHTWTEIVYNQRGYRLAYVKDGQCAYILTDEAGAMLLCAESATQITLHRALPLCLLVMVVARILDEISDITRPATQ